MLKKQKLAQKAAANLQEENPGLQRAFPPGGKDITAAWEAGFDLREWMQGIIEPDTDELPDPTPGDQLSTWKLLRSVS